MTTPNHAEFYNVCRELEQGQCLTLRHLIRVFGLDCADLLLCMQPTVTVKLEATQGYMAKDVQHKLED